MSELAETSPVGANAADFLPGQTLTTEREPILRRFRSALRPVVVPFAASRVIVLIALVLGRRDATQAALDNAGPGIGPRWLESLTFFDGRWYTKIATSGYDRITTVFYPLYPLTVRLLGGTTAVRAALVALAISHVCLLLALVVLYRYVARWHGCGAARLSVIIMCFWPASVFWSAAYTESIALLLLLVTWSSFRSERFVVALVAGAAAGLTRNFGFVVSAALAVEMVRSWRARSASDRSTRSWALAALAVGAPGATSLSFLLWVRMNFGSSAGVAAQRDYGRAWSWPWSPVWDDIASLRGVIFLAVPLSLLCLAAVVGVTWHSRRALTPGEHLLAWGVLAMHLCLARIYVPRTVGTARYVMTTFPVSIGLARWAQSRSRRTQVVLGALLMAVCYYGANQLGAGAFDLG